MVLILFYTTKAKPKEEYTPTSYQRTRPEKEIFTVETLKKKVAEESQTSKQKQLVGFLAIKTELELNCDKISRDINNKKSLLSGSEAIVDFFRVSAYNQVILQQALPGEDLIDQISLLYHDFNVANSYIKMVINALIHNPEQKQDVIHEEESKDPELYMVIDNALGIEGVPGDRRQRARASDQEQARKHAEGEVDQRSGAGCGGRDKRGADFGRDLHRRRRSGAWSAQRRIHSSHSCRD